MDYLHLENLKGNGTSLISLQFSPSNHSKIIELLEKEIDTASYIKSNVNRQSVVGAITLSLTLVRNLCKYNGRTGMSEISGIHMFCGELLDGSIIEYTILSKIPCNTLYICDNKFHVPTQDLNAPTS
jgi:peptide subunit release factor 1 (eRF1)